MIQAQHKLGIVTWAMALAIPMCVTAAEPFTAKVWSVKDGDTMVVLQRNKQIDIRLEGTDCPELGQPFGQKTKQAAAKAE